MLCARRKRTGGAHPTRRARRGLAFVLLVAATIVTLPAAVAAPTKKKPSAAAKREPAKPPALPKGCTELGIYRDDPVGSFPSLAKSFGQNLTTVSTYITVGQGLDPKLAALARARGLRLLVTWMPDGGTDEPDLPRYSLAKITGGSLDTDLRTLARELKAARVPVLFRPMPEPNTPWYAWSGTTNGNSAEEYVLAWKHVRRVVRRIAGPRLSFLWSPYARSVPETPENAIERYFPGSPYVDVVGTSGYNFGTEGDLTWTDPKALFLPAYTTIQKLASKPFWITETASTGTGGSKTAWIASIRSLKADMPQLRGLVWYDVADPEGDFRLAGPSLQTAKSLLKRRCIV